MAFTYTQLQDIKNRIVRELANEQAKTETAVGAFTEIKNALTQMESNYSQWAIEVNDMAAANPNDDAISALKAERDLLVAEFGTSKTLATAYETAVNGV
jgi:hypothetical protein